MSGFYKGAIEEFHDVQDFLARIVYGSSGAKLQNASRVCGEDSLRFGLFRVIHFVGKKIERGFRLRDVVNAGGAATEIGERHLHELDGGNRTDKFSRGFANLLSVNEMAGILVGDAHGQWTQRRYQAEINEKFGNVANFR